MSFFTSDEEKSEAIGENARGGPGGRGGSDGRYGGGLLVHSP